jgi:Tfp pilus assembly protein PilW
MLISLAILSLAIGAIAPLLLDSARVNRSQQMTMTIQADARNCLELVTSVIRSSGWDPRKTGFAALTLNASDPASADHIEVFADLNEDGDTADDGEDVLVQLSGKQLQWRKSTGGTLVVLADDVTNDANGDGTAELMFTPDSATAPTKITVKITTQSASRDPRSGQFIRYTVSDVVALRGKL